MTDTVIKAISDLETAGQALDNADAASDTAGKAVDAAQLKLDNAKSAKNDADTLDAAAADAYDKQVDLVIAALSASKRTQPTAPAVDPTK